MNIPERLGKYPVTDVLGRGAMGIVYRAYDPVIKRPVAIKTIRKELIEDDDKAESMTERFRREAQAAGGLNHPGIVAVYEYGEDAQHAYIAMEYVEGNSLREYLTRGATFDERDTVSIMSQLLDALEFAHRNSVWHRDIKPANIIVMSNGRIKLADFGIARIETADRTRTNVLMGTPGYIAPEQYLGQSIDHRVDIFATGVLFYQLLAGQPPFRGRPEAVMHDVCYHDPPPPSQADAAHRWPQYDAIVLKALHKSPDDRFPDAHSFRDAILGEYAHPVSHSISEATIIQTVARPVGVEPSSATPSQASRALPTSTATPTSPPPTGWGAAEMATVEKALARHVGPVAKVLVRRAAKTHKDLPSLVQELLGAIDRREDREAFTKAVLGRPANTAAIPTLATTQIVGSIPPTATVQAPSGPPLTEADVERAVKLLAPFVGPIAKVLAKRSAGQSVSRGDFAQRIAEHLERDADRERFLKQFDAPAR